MIRALEASIALFVFNVFSTLMVIYEAEKRPWLAATFESLSWLFYITTTNIVVLSSGADKYTALVLCTVANFSGAGLTTEWEKRHEAKKESA